MSDELNFLLHIPEDVSTHILLKLPTKSLLTCTCVCKTWNSFIKSPSFFKSHLQNTISSNKRNNSGRCLLHLCTLAVRESVRASGVMPDRFLLCSQELNNREELHFIYQVRYGFQLLASCNGLVLLLHSNYHCECGVSSKPLILWNPVIRKSIVMDNCPMLCQLEVIGFGFDSRTSDYKVVTISERVLDIETTTLMVHLYSLKANSWKRIPDIEAAYPRRGYFIKRMVYLNGLLYFVAYKEPRFTILGFDLSDEVFHEIMLPDCIAGDCFVTCQHFYLWTRGESLVISLMDDSAVLKIWGMEGSLWTLLSTINLGSEEYARCLKTTGLVFVDDSFIILVFSCGRNYASTVFLHDLKSRETKKIGVVEEQNRCYFLGDYVESLALLDKGNELRRFIQNDTSGSSSSSSS